MFDYLLAPGEIGGLPVGNRVFMPAMLTGLASCRGEVTDDMLAYYHSRAASGPGVVVVEVTCVDAPQGKAALNQLHIDHPGFLSGLNRLAEVIKSGGSRAFIQLSHAGRQTNLLFTAGQTPLAPSPLPDGMARVIPREASLEDIERMRQKFVTAAGLAQAAGFEGVELHAAHGYLLSQFLSPYTNRRRDDYGGDIHARVRLVDEIIREIKRWYPGLVVGVRFNVTDFIPGGIEPEEGVEIAVRLELAGADYLNVSGGMHDSGLTTVEPASFQEGWRVHLATAVKARVKVPVVAGGVIRHPEFAEQVLREGRADFVWVGRNQIADAQWVAKVRTGRAGDIRPCLSCNLCIGRSFQHLHLSCSVNPRAGRERQLRLLPLPVIAKPRRVLVAGGGPAGMAAATALARRGHQVTLAEAGPKLGGKLTLAARPPYRGRIKELQNYLIRELKDAPINILTGQTVSEELVAALQPQVLVVATGGQPRVWPELEPNPMVIQAVEVLEAETAVQGEQITVVGGGATGCETALFLATHGNQVVMVEAGPRVARGLNRMSRRDLILCLEKAGVKMMTGWSVEQVNGNNVQIKAADGRNRATLVTDRVVLALGFDASDTLDGGLRRLVPESYIIGDAARPRNIAAALYEAEILARRL